MRVSFNVYADFEFFAPELWTGQPKPETCPHEFCYHIKCFDETLYSQQPVTFIKECNDDAVAQRFMGTLERTSNTFMRSLSSQKNMIMTTVDKLYQNSTLCHMCNEELGEDRERDHCHLSGKLREAAHQFCNLKYKVPKFFPVVFHSLSGYDSHRFIKTLGSSEGDISCIPYNEETIFLLRFRSSLTNFINKEGKEVNVKRE